MAILDSVTVSIAAEMIGTLRVMFRVSRVEVWTSEGITSDAAGMSRTSSNVSPTSSTFLGSSPPVVTYCASLMRPAYLPRRKTPEKPLLPTGVRWEA